MKLTIDRKRWLRGVGSDKSKLYVSKKFAAEEMGAPEVGGKMCCLGFYCRAQMLTLAEIKDKSTPANLEMSNLDPRLKGLVKRRLTLKSQDNQPRTQTTKVCDELMQVNDSEVEGGINYSQIKNEADREAKIAKLFKRIGVVVEFVG